MGIMSRRRQASVRSFEKTVVGNSTQLPKQEAQAEEQKPAEQPQEQAIAEEKKIHIRGSKKNKASEE